MRAAIAFLGILPVCLSQELNAIRVNVRLVNVALTVRDAQGKFVTSLTKDDFEVSDDGQPQPISFFARGEDLPLTLGLIADVSGSQEHFVKQHQHDIGVFLKDVLTPRDRAFLICFGNHLRLASDFSASGSELIDGLKKLEKREVSRDWPPRISLRWNRLLRRDLSRDHSEARACRPGPPRAHHLQRRRGQFQRPYHDGYH